MLATMDRVGRLVIPKEVRDRLGIGEIREFDVVIDGTAIRLEPRFPPARTIVEVDGWPTLSPVAGAVLTDDDIRALRDADQR